MTQKPLVLQRNVVEIWIFASVFKDLKGLIPQNTTFLYTSLLKFKQNLMFFCIFFTDLLGWAGRGRPRNYLGGQPGDSA